MYEDPPKRVEIWKWLLAAMSLRWYEWAQNPDRLAVPIGLSLNQTLNGDSSAQLSFDLRTGRRTAIHSGSPCAEQRSACIALNRIRTRGILEATQLASSGESLSLDARYEAVARLSRDRDVPLIPLENLGIHHDDEGLLNSDRLTALPSGAEAIPYFDKDWGVVYKLFDLRIDGSLGKKIELVRNLEDGYDLTSQNATLVDTLEKLAVLNHAGAHPTEIVGLSDSGDYLIAKQPLAHPRGEFESDRKIAVSQIKGVIPEFTGPGLRHTVVVMWLENRAWLVGDLHERNIMRDQDGIPTIIDALIGPVPQAAIKELRWLREAVEDAQALREERGFVTRKRFEDVDDASL
jgi:hypothetical protein